MGASYDFLNYVSFPSAAKIDTDKAIGWSQAVGAPPLIPVGPGDKIKVELCAKGRDINPLPNRPPSRETISAWDGKKWVRIGKYPLIRIPVGTFGWSKFSSEELIIPENVEAVRIGVAGERGTTWFDDEKLYRNGEVAYENYFTGFRPSKIVPPMIRPPEVIVGTVQRFKAGRAEGEIIRPPMAPIL